LFFVLASGASQVFVSLVVSIGMLILFANCKPYLSKSDDLLAQFCQLSLTFAMAVGILEMASESFQVCMFVWELFVCAFSTIDSSFVVSSLVSFLPHWGFKTKPKLQDAVFGPLLITSTSVNVVIGIVFIVSDFVATVFPKVTANLVGVWSRTGPSSSELSRTRGVRHGIASKFRLRKTAVSPAQVAGDIGNMSPEISESSMVKPQVEAGCMDHNHDMVDQGFVRGPWLRSTTDQGREIQWNGNVKQNLEKSAVALPVEETSPVKRIFTSSKTRKMSSILASHGQSARENDGTFW
jgi:hypothetical protein